MYQKQKAYFECLEKLGRTKTMQFSILNSLGNRLILFIVLLLFFAAPSNTFAQKIDSTKEVTSKHPKATKIISNMLYALSFLHYTDRRKDRILDGPEDFEEYRGKKINSINYRILKPYGVSIEHPDSPVTKKLSKFANGIHISTKLKVIKNEMLVKEGERIDPQLMADMERNIWNKGIYKDQKIVLEPLGYDSNLVDMNVTVQDLMTWNLVDIIGAKSASIGIELKNFLGLSQSWNNYISLNYRKDKLWSFNGGYEYRNIASSQLQLNFDYNYDPFNKGLEFYIGRRFYSSQTKWAGYAFSNFYKQSKKETNFLSSAIPTNVMFNAQAVWFARAYTLPFIRMRYDKNMTYKFIISAKFNRLQYITRPFARAPDNSIFFINNRSFMVGAGFARWDYYTEQNVNKLVETEFFTKGFNTAFLCGLSNEEEVGSRYYTAIVGTYAYKIQRFGYFAIRGKWGTYIKNERIQNQVLNMNLLFFSNTVNLGKKIFFRQFVRAYYNQGWQFANNQDIYLNSGNGGVRGIFLNLLRGQRTFSMSFEPNFYARFKVFGFTGSVFGFADIAMAGSGDGGYFNSKIIQGYGLGLRVRNLKLGIDYFDITFAYYPNLQSDKQKPWNFLGNFSNSNAIGNYQGTLFDSRTMIFQNAPINEADVN